MNIDFLNLVVCNIKFIEIELKVLMIVDII